MGDASKGEIVVFVHFLALAPALTWTHGLRCGDFDNLAAPARLLRTLTFLKQRSTEEASASRARAHEGTFRDCARRTLTTISNAEFASAARDRVALTSIIF